MVDYCNKSKDYGIVESKFCPSSTGSVFLFFGTTTLTESVHVPPLSSSASNDISYTLPFHWGSFCALICAESMPTPNPSGDLSLP